MGSFRSKGRNQGLNRRRGKTGLERQSLPRLEWLEDRRLLSGSNGGALTPLWTPTSSNLLDAQNGPMANLGVQLVDVYAAYAKDGSTASLATEFPLIEFQNGMVGVQLKSLGGDFSQYQTQLTDAGMQIVTSSAYYGLVDGFAPVNDLPTIAELAQTQSGAAQMKPVLSSEYQGIAYNEAETSLFADVARTKFGVDGTGVTIGVLSDSVSQYQGGLADSYKTGDLNPNNPVNVIADGPAGSTDEGRAMLENIHDIAPGANLAFATATPNELAYANNIKALANQAHANIIADDVIYSDEPMFQNGIVAQAVNTVTAQGVTYFGAAGNQANDGYLSTFRPVNATVQGLGSGTYMNFNPNGGTNVELPITTDGANAELSFQYDQPYQFQEPAGSPGVVSSNVNIYVLDSSGNVVVGASANQNNVAAQQPWQDVVIPNAGSYEVVIQVMSGPNPGHVEFVNMNENVNLVVNPEYGSAGGTYYPTSFGHHTDVNTIGIGATPWWAPAPYLNQQPLASEPFSSYGPGLYDLTSAGVPKTPVLSLNPTVTAPDGGNTSFFSPGQTIDTSNPPFPGEPATTTNLAQPNLPTFFGTSSATPNAAAVAALMEQLVPNLTPTDIRAALIASAANQPMNGATPGTWAADGGYGLINAIDALNAVSNLSVAATSPGQGATVTTAPTSIQVTFNKAVNASTLSAADLSFSSTPSGVSVVVGAPVAATNSNGTASTSVFNFPITFIRTPGSSANGSYTFSIQSPNGGTPVVAIDGKDLVASGAINFTLADTTAPVITNTSINGRVITIQFSKPLDPSTVTLSNFMVLRQNGAATWPPSPSTLSNYFNLSNDPRAAISYNASTDTVTLDYSALPQTEMPSDRYAIVVQTALANGGGVTDIVGNPLDGYYTGSFPTTALNGGPSDFIQNLGFEALQAPTITTFTMSPTSDTGIAGDQNTNNTQPQFIGQVYDPFPGSIAGDQVYVQFSGDNGGTTNLAVGGGGRGYTGTYDVSATTDASGTFTVTAPVLPEGFQTAVAVVVGQPDLPPLPGYAGTAGDAFRIDKTSPEITAASFTQGGTALPLPNGPQPNSTNISSLSTLSLTVIDPVNPQSAPFGTPSAVQFDALNPTTASNVSNYSLVNVTTNTDESQYVATATFVPTSPTINAAGYITAFNGYINLTFNAGLPTGTYEFVAHTHELQYPGLTDAAGNYLNDTSVTGEGTKDFILNFAVQTTPTFITSMAMESSYSANGSTVVGGAQSYYELPPASGTNTRDNVAAPPTTFVIDLSNPIPYANYTPDVLLVRSANSSSSASDGDFGTLGQGGLGATGTGFTVVSGTTVNLYNYNVTTGTSTPVESGGSGNRLVLTIQPGTTLPADVYRLYIPNQVEPNGTDTRIFDIYGHQLDGQFLGTPTSQQSPDFPNAKVTLPEYQNQMSDGTIRMNDMSGTGNPGGAFMTGFTVVPYGNVVYARPGFSENPLLPNGAGLSNGSMAAPYPVLAPEGDPSTAPANPTHDPNGGLNSPYFFQPGNFNLSYDYSGSGTFQQSAFYAASQLSYNGPVVIVAEAGLPSRDPLTGQVNQPSFSLIAPAGNTDAGASVPFNTTLVMQAGSAIKFQGTALFVQNQGSALQAWGTAANPVYFTSYNNASVGGQTNNNPDTTPHAGDWAGLVFRNFDYAATQPSFPVVAGQTTGALIGVNGGNAISGAQDAMSIINNAVVQYGGGNVPGDKSTFYSGITLYNSRPTIANSSITNIGGTGGTVGAIGADFNSLMEDDTARGPLIRNVTVGSDNINGFYLFAESNGLVEPTNAMTYPTNPTTLGGAVNYTMAIPLPIVVTGQIFVGQQLLENTGGDTQEFGDRLYIQPGSLLKFDKGAGLDVVSPQASLNVGSRSYINGFDQNPGYNPNSPGFVAESASDPTVLFTTIYDDTASTPFVPAINVLGETVTPTLTPGMWGSVGILTGADVVINAATFEYGGGALNTQSFTIDSQSVLSFITGLAVQTFPLPSDWNPDAGTHAYITNNNFYDNFDAAMQIEPNGLLAANPLTPLASGHPFFRGNVMTGNGIDGLSVVTNRAYEDNASTNWSYIGPIEQAGAAGYANQTVSAVWDSTDLTYVVEGTIVLGPGFFRQAGSGANNVLPQPNTTTWSAEPSPTVTLTIQAALPGTLLADGSTIPSPGQSVIVKMLNDFSPLNAGSLATPSASLALGEQAGAGFVAGVDNGVDPPTNSLIDPGAYSEIRILGIPGNANTGQQRVPVIITSLRDATVGTTVRGVKMYNIAESIPVYTQIINPGASLDTPAAGDGGYIMIGGNSMTEYDPTNPFDGSIISNADISYLTKIDVSGGGIVNTFNNISGTAGAATLTNSNWYDQLAGYYAPVNQLNAAMSFTISDSNLSDFADAAVFVHPGPAGAINFDWTGTNGGIATTPAAPTRNSLMGEPVYLYMYNNTITNSGQGVHINATTGNDTTGTSVYEAVLLNNTFYGDTYAIQTEAPAHTTNPDNSLSSVDVLAMNNIFDNSSADAVDLEGQAGLSQLQYNLFYQNGTNVVATTNDGDFAGNQFPIYGDPQFVGPIGSGDASAQNYELKSTSIAIDAGRSEIGPNAAGNAIYPGTTLSFANGQVIGIRTDPYTLPTSPTQEYPGKNDPFGDFGFFGGASIAGGIDPRQIVTLPGSGVFSFPDQWQPVLPGTANSYSGPSSNADTYNYQPYSGIRDILGYIRYPDPNVPGIGYGSNPFIDIGAYQYVNLHPPEVTAVTATESSSTASSSSGSSTTTIPFYSVGGNAGANTTPQTINVTFNEPMDPSTLNSNTVQLEELGVVPGTTQQFINLAGKIQYNSATDTLVINLGSAGLNLQTDKYRLILFGNGSPVVANTQGIALDGEDLSNNNDPSTGSQLPLPSGNGYPGGNFYDTFIINSTPPSILPGSLAMSASTDSNIVGDAITNNGNPAFTGTISEPNTALVPLAGQTAILNVGIALDVNGTIETFFNASQLPASLSSYAQYIRPDAGTALTDSNGNFTVTVGQDGASTGLVTNTSPLPDLYPIYNVGSSGILSPLPGTDSGYYVAQVVAQDQSGNQSNPADPNAQVPFVVDQTAPTASFVSPTSGQVVTSLTNGQVQFTIDTSKNIDLTHLTAASIQVVSAGPDGILGTADDVKIPINPSSISVTYLDKGNGGKGAEQITFSTEGTLTNDLYSVTLLNTGTDPVQDIAGNPLASPVTEQFAISVPSLSKNLFVGGSSYVTSSSATIGTRENPYPTIGAAMAAATAGDVVAVLPGVYNENVTLKQFVRLLSANINSSDSTVFTTSTGDPLQTIIRAPAVSSATTDITVTANGVQSFSALPTEIAGFTIASPLVGDPATGTINTAGIGIDVVNSNIVIDKNYFADSGVGIYVATSGSNPLAPRVFDNVVVGNIDGMVLNDSSTSTTPTTSIINNDFVFNTYGLSLLNTAATTMQAEIDSNIFWQNHDQSNARNGLAIYSANPGKVNLLNNLFQGNGSSDSFTSDITATNDLGNGFSAAALNSTSPDSHGNFVGNPAFAFPIDPRPGSDGPANLFVSSNFELTAASAAIDNAWEASAIPTDILGASQVKIGNDGWGIAGYGPRDIGAYEFDGTGGQPVGGAFRVVTTSLVPVGGAYQAGGATLVTATSPTSVTLTFSGNVNPSDIQATDLALSGSADNPSSPVQATSLTWIDAHTVQFNLSGTLNPGTLDLSVPAGLIQGANGQRNLSYSDSVVLQLGTPSPQPNPTPYPSQPTAAPISTPAPTSTTPAPTPTSTVTSLPITPPPAPSPVYGHGHKFRRGHFPVRHGHGRVHVKQHIVRHVTHAHATKHVVPKHGFVRAHVHPRATTSVNFFFSLHHKKKK